MWQINAITIRKSTARIGFPREYSLSLLSLQLEKANASVSSFQRALASYLNILPVILNGESVKGKCVLKEGMC